MLYVWGYSKLNISYFSFTLAITCSNSIVWKHFKSIVVGFCARKSSSYSILEDIDVSALITCSSGENVTRELNGLSWAKPLLHISVPWSPGQFLWILLFSCDFTWEIPVPSTWNVFRHYLQKALCLPFSTDVIQL